MRTFTITYHHTHNYGALLQAYALQQVIESLGHTNIIFEYPYGANENSKLDLSIKSVIRNIYLSYLKFLRKKYEINLDNYFAEFHKKHLKLSRAFNNMDDLKKNYPKVDCFITGSDQVWNLNTLKEFIPARFLDFGDKSTRRISYAASIESLNYSDSDKKMVKNYLSKFDAISLREKSAKDYIESFINLKVERVLDPVFLLKKEDWRKIEIQPRIKSPYILCYQVQRNQNMQNVVNYLHKLTGYPVVSICNSSIKWIKSDFSYFDVSPEEFIGLYDNASIVVSASFHGTAFGLLFEKPTYGLIKQTRGNRIREILELFDLGDFCISSTSKIPKPKIDTIKLNKILDKERKKSLDFLNGGIGNE